MYFLGKLEHIFSSLECLENVFVEWSDEANVSGNIYEGRVDSISSSLGAAFLNIGIHKKAFLKLSNAPQALRYR